MVTVRVSRLASRQFGVVARTQLLDAGLGTDAIQCWLEGGRLHRLHPGVYALGHVALPVEARLVAALLHGGPGSGLSHDAAAFWWQLVKEKPEVIDVVSPRRARDTEGVRVHRTTSAELVRHRRLPLTSVAQTLRDLAPSRDFDELRYLLAEAEYRGLLHLDSLRATAGRGRAGSAKLRRAAQRHQPLLARTRTRLERRFIRLVEDAGLPLPEMNVKVSRMHVDAVWRKHKVAVELDGGDGHGKPNQLDRDHRRDAVLRSRGYTVLRYSWWQVFEDPDMVVADLVRALSAS